MSGQALVFHQLTFVPEEGEVVVGRPATGTYAVFPPDGAELLQKMSGGMPPDEAEAWYLNAFGEPPDLDEFIETIRDLGFIRDAGTTPGDDASAPRFHSWGRVLLSPPAFVCYAAVVALWIVVAARHHDILPAPRQIFFTSSLLVVQAVITFSQIPLVFLHEGFHALAGRRLGLPTRLSVSNRLTYIVFETQLNGVLSVPRKKRYLPFLAGMLCDFVVLGVLGILADLTREPDHALSLIGRVCLALAFTVFMRIVWQFQLYLRTDLYYVFATALNCYDLHEASKALLWNRIWRRLGRVNRVVGEAQWTDHDRKVGKWYGPFLVLGVGTFIAITVLATVPIAFQYFATIFHNLTSGHVGPHFWDSAFSLTVNVAQVIALIALSRRKRRRQGPAGAVPALAGRS